MQKERKPFDVTRCFALDKHPTVTDKPVSTEWSHSAQDLNGCRVTVPDLQSKRTARNASQPWIGADDSAALISVQTHGRIAAPTFFWDGEATRATGNRCTPIA
jgi:hypothetical protein